MVSTTCWRPSPWFDCPIDILWKSPHRHRPLHTHPTPEPQFKTPKMASVSSLDRDLRKMRLDKYTPAAANEVRAWIEGVLGDRLAPGDLLGALKDGVALCKYVQSKYHPGSHRNYIANHSSRHRLVNLAIPPPGVKCKTSSMPFVQMENISHFLRACKSPPLNLQEHDMFLTVDLYESKDPAQVLQCLGAFSRAASTAKPSVFPTPIGARALSPQRTGANAMGHTLSPTPTGRPRGMSNSSNASSAYGSRLGPLSASKTGGSSSGRWSPNKSPSSGNKSPSVSSWSSRAHEGATSPAWNIAQYGYMGGASQGNLGISFGGRRQITSAGPAVPNLAEKEKRRKEKEAGEQRQREEEEARRTAEREAEEEHARLEEERRWEEETMRQREDEARRVAEEKRRWEEEERQWKITEEKRRREEEEAEQRLAEERTKIRSRGNSGARLHGQYLSQYQAEQGAGGNEDPNRRIRELEEQLERARQREAEYENERQHRVRMKSVDAKARARSRSRPRTGTPSRQDSWARGDDSDGEGLKQSYTDRKQRPQPPPRQNSRPLPDPATASTPPARVKTHRTGESASKVKTHNTGGSSRPLPDPRSYSSPPRPPSAHMNRTDRFLATNAAPAAQQASPTYSRELGLTAEQDGEDRRRAQTQQRTKAGGWASKSLLEREMEMERQRQREWEESQKETAKAARSTDGVQGIGGGLEGRWDVSQWSGYTGGDNANKNPGQGIGSGRRQIVGPRPLPGTPGSGR